MNTSTSTKVRGNYHRRTRVSRPRYGRIAAVVVAMAAVAILYRLHPELFTPVLNLIALAIIMTIVSDQQERRWLHFRRIFFKRPHRS